jgi:hypothetical protein
MDLTKTKENLKWMENGLRTQKLNTTYEETLNQGTSNESNKWSHQLFVS